MRSLAVSNYIDAIEIDGDFLAVASGRASPTASVPTCPGWTVADLLRHIGYVHRWAARFVAEQLSKPGNGASEAEQLHSGPPDAQLVTWFREGYEALANTIRNAPPDVACWTFFDAPSPLAFWARRQAHETGIHRVDAELAAGGAVTSFPAVFAADGIDELIFGFARRSRRLRSDTPRSLAVHADDTGDNWLVRIGREGAETTRDGGPADCTVRGSAVDLYLLLWNRREPQGLDVRGDAEVLSGWRANMRVTWS